MTDANMEIMRPIEIGKSVAPMMMTPVACPTTSNGVSNLVPTEHEMLVYNTMAEQAVSSKMYRGIGEKAGVMMIMLAAREYGIPPMIALNKGINIIQGCIELSARVMSAMIRRAGHQIRVIENDATKCILEGIRTDTKETLKTSFTVQEAEKAGLVKTGGGWTKWPKDMCFARALSRLARQLFSDVIGTAYVEGEIKESECEIVREEEKDDGRNIIADAMHYLSLFPEDKKAKARHYLEAVKAHYDWTVEQTYEFLLKDKEVLLEKFEKWSSKN